MDFIHVTSTSPGPLQARHQSQSSAPAALGQTHEVRLSKGHIMALLRQTERFHQQNGGCLTNKNGDSPINIGNSPADLVDFNQDGFYHNKTGKFDTWMWDLSSKIVQVTNRLAREKVNSTNQCEYFMVNYRRTIFCQEG